jgi:hypothetical protein
MYYLCMEEIPMTPTTYINEEFGIEAIIADGNNVHPCRVILRDTDADATVSVFFGSFEACHAKAVDFGCLHEVR